MATTFEDDGDRLRAVDRRHARVECGECGEVTVGEVVKTMEAPAQAPSGHRFPGVKCSGCGKVAWFEAAPPGWRWRDEKRVGERTRGGA